jgi:drug/metabolite transporter (DMT)-like permease
MPTLPLRTSIAPQAQLRSSINNGGYGFRTGAVVSLVIAIVLWGANWPIMKAGLHHATPLWFSAIRFLSGAACLFAFEAARGDLKLPTRADLPFVASIGLLQMMAFTALGAFAMTQIPAGRSAVLSYTTLLWVVPASIFVFRERPRFTSLIGVAIAAGGVLFLINPYAQIHSGVGMLPNGLLLAASFCWAICILHLRYFKSPSSAYALAPWQMLLAGVALALIAYFEEGPSPGDGSVTFWATISFVGPIATAFCFCAVNAASTWLPATGMSIAMLGVPLTGVAISTITLGEALTPDLVGGCAAIVAGILLQLKFKTKGAKQ